MKCPICNTWSSVRTTRDSPTFGYTRRRECANEHRFTTQEVIVPQEAIDEERRTHLENNQKRLEPIRKSDPKRFRNTTYREY